MQITFKADYSGIEDRVNKNNEPYSIVRFISGTGDVLETMCKDQSLCAKISNLNRYSTVDVIAELNPRYKSVNLSEVAVLVATK